MAAPPWRTAPKARARGGPSTTRAAAPRSPELETVSWWDDFYAVVRRIPRGKVTTYGAVALLAGYPRAARHVGWAMAALNDAKAKHRDVPWQRVLAAAPGERARVSIKDPVGGAIQRAMLEAEGVVFDRLGRVELARFGWSGRAARRRTAVGQATVRRAAVSRAEPPPPRAARPRKRRAQR